MLRCVGMADELDGLIITLSPDLSGEAAESRMNAIKLIDGVIDVRPIVADTNQFFAAQQAKHELKMKIANFLTEILRA